MKISTKIDEALESGEPGAFSVEVFVPETAEGVELLKPRIDRIGALEPLFLDIAGWASPAASSSSPDSPTSSSSPSSGSSTSSSALPHLPPAAEQSLRLASHAQRFSGVSACMVHLQHGLLGRAEAEAFVDSAAALGVRNFFVEWGTPAEGDEIVEAGAGAGARAGEGEGSGAQAAGRLSPLAATAAALASSSSSSGACGSSSGGTSSRGPPFSQPADLVRLIRERFGGAPPAPGAGAHPLTDAEAAAASPILVAVRGYPSGRPASHPHPHPLPSSSSSSSSSFSSAKPGDRGDTREAGLARLAEECRAGAGLVVAQHVFDSSDFVSFVADARAAGVPPHVPIIPSVLLLHSAAATAAANEACGVDMPRALAARLGAAAVAGAVAAGAEPGSGSVAEESAYRSAGVAFTAGLCRDLLGHMAVSGVGGSRIPLLHVLTMNLEAPLRPLLTELLGGADGAGGTAGGGAGSAAAGGVGGSGGGGGGSGAGDGTFTPSASVALRRKLPWRPSGDAARAREDVRPIHWANRPASYVERTSAWSSFPCGRWAGGGGGGAAGWGGGGGGGGWAGGGADSPSLLSSSPPVLPYSASQQQLLVQQQYQLQMQQQHWRGASAGAPPSLVGGGAPRPGAPAAADSAGGGANAFAGGAAGGAGGVVVGGAAGGGTGTPRPFTDIPEAQLVPLSAGTPEERRALWGEAPRSHPDVWAVFAAYVEGAVPRLPWCDVALLPETALIRQPLAALNRAGFLTINSQPRVSGARSDDATFGWGGPGGLVYQKAYVECFVPPTHLAALMRACAKAGAGAARSSVTYHAVDASGRCFTNSRAGRGALSAAAASAAAAVAASPTLAAPTSPRAVGASGGSGSLGSEGAAAAACPPPHPNPTVSPVAAARPAPAFQMPTAPNDPAWSSVNAVTWGVFPDKEILQPTVMDPEAFRTPWRAEAFALWERQWAAIYEDADAVAADLLHDIHDTYYLVSMVDNDFVGGDVFAVFSDALAILGGEQGAAAKAAAGAGAGADSGAGAGTGAGTGAADDPAAVFAAIAAAAAAAAATSANTTPPLGGRPGSFGGGLSALASLPGTPLLGSKQQ